MSLKYEPSSEPFQVLGAHSDGALSRLVTLDVRGNDLAAAGPPKTIYIYIYIYIYFIYISIYLYIYIYEYLCDLRLVTLNIRGNDLAAAGPP